MKSKGKVLILVGALAVVLIGATIAYTALSAGVTAGNLAPVASPAPSADAPAPSASPDGTAPEEEQSELMLAPDLTVYDAQGNEVTLSSLRGKPVVINLWASWCTYCKQELPHLQTLYEQYGDEVHFMILNMADGQRETEQDGWDYMAGQTYTFPTYVDRGATAAYLYGVSGFPATFFIDAEGRAVTYAPGAVGEELLRTGISYIYPAE